MKKGRTSLALPLLGLGVLVFAGFFAPSLNSTAHAAPVPFTDAEKKISEDLVALVKDTNAYIANYGPWDYFYNDARKTSASKTLPTGCAWTTPVTKDPGVNKDIVYVCKKDTVTLTCTIGYSDGSVPSCDSTNASGAKGLAGSSYDPTSDATITSDANGKNNISQNTTADPNSCGVTNIGQCLVSFMGWIISKIEWFILLIAAAILGLANYMLGWATYITVFQFGNLVGNSDGLLAAWGVMRDVANIVLLFGFIFMGVSTILNLPHSEYTAKKALPTLIIFALLLNFSLFAVEAIIDVSNGIATSIYEQTTGGSGVCESTTSTVDCIFKQGIGGQVMSMSGVGSVLSLNYDDHGNQQVAVVVYAGLIIFVVITTLVLFAASIMLIIRAVVLAFLMVTAPIGFAGMAIPPLHEMSQKWWKELISQAIFAPVYFLLALLSLLVMKGVMTSLGSTDGTQKLADVFSAGASQGLQSNITIAITFALIIGFMVAALIFAKSSSASGTSMAMTGAGKMAFGTLGFVGRQTGGRVSLLAANKIATSRIGQTSMGRRLYGIANKGASSSFDFRQTSGAKKAEGFVGGLGTVRKSVQHGTHGIEEDTKKAKVEYAKKIVQSHHEVEQQKELEDAKKEIAEQKKTREGELNQAGAPLQQAVDDQLKQNAQRRAADAREIAGVQADLNQAVASGNTAEAARLQGQLGTMLAANAQTTAQEDLALDVRKQALQAHQQRAKTELAEFDKRIKRIDTEINGGEFLEADGVTTTTFEGISTDAKRKKYGKNLENSFMARNFATGTISGHTNFEAGREVIRNAGRTGVERAIADLQSNLNTTAPTPVAAPVGGPTPTTTH